MKQKRILGFWAGTRAYYAEVLRKQLVQLERRMVALEIKKRLKKF